MTRAWSRLPGYELVSYLTGGSSAVMEGWRETTIEIDLRFEPESDELLRAMPLLKERLGINVELASPREPPPTAPDPTLIDSAVTDWTTPLATVAVRRLEAAVWEALPTLVYATTTAPMPSRPRKMFSEGRSLYLGIGSGGERRRGGGRGGAQMRLLWLLWSVA